MDLTLTGILRIVGSLNDRPGDDPARDRFRLFLDENIKEVGQVRDYVNECLRMDGDQYDFALQDLVNFVGNFLGFEVSYGLYRGARTPEQIGFDGHWRSPTSGLYIVIETKTTDKFPIQTAALLGYIDGLVSKKVIPSREEALGLYVVGRPNPKLKQLENAIVAEKLTHRLRIISVDALLSLAERMNDSDVNHDDILAVIRPSGPMIDPIATLVGRLVSPPPPPPLPPDDKGDTDEEYPNGVNYWLTPVRSDEEGTAEDTISTLVGDEHIYAFGERTPGRRSIKPGDWICFYSSGNGVVAHARVKSSPRKESNPKVRHFDQYPWLFDVENEQLYFNEPVVIDAALREKLDAFKDKDVNKNWAWYVQATNRITEHDFRLLTREDAAIAVS